MRQQPYQVEDFFKTTQDPPANAEIIYRDGREHCFTGDTENPNPSVAALFISIICPKWRSG